VRSKKKSSESPTFSNRRSYYLFFDYARCSAARDFDFIINFNNINEFEFNFSFFFQRKNEDYLKQLIK